MFDLRCSRDGLESPVWILGWERTLHRAFGRAVNNGRPFAPTLNTVIHGMFIQVSRGN